MTANENSRNSVAKEILKNYLSHEKSLDYAVLVEGDWGAGKTYLVDSLLQEVLTKKSDYLYLSLHGVSDIKYVYGELAFDYIYKKRLGDRWGGPAKSLTKLLLNRNSFDYSFLSENIFDAIKNKKVCIFDDLERNKLKEYEVLGLVDKILKGSNCKVVLIANERELLENFPKFGEVKEKVIGKTIKVLPTSEVILEKEIAEELRGCELYKGRISYGEFLQNNKDILYQVYEESLSKNLRLFERAVRSFKSVFDISSKARVHDDGRRMLAYFYIAFYIEYYSNNFSDINFGRIGTYWLAGGDENEAKLSGYVKSKYKKIIFGSEPVSIHMLLELVAFHGYCEKTLVAQMENSKYSSCFSEEKSWRKIWDWSTKSNLELEKAIAEMESDITTEKFIGFGDVMHIAGIKIWLARNDVSKQSVKGAVLELKKYINRIYKSENFTSEFYSENLDHEMFSLGTSYEGLGYTEIDSPEFKSVMKHLKKMSERKLRLNIRRDAVAAYNNRLSAPQDFFRKISILSRADGGFSDTPFFEFLDPYQFYLDVLDIHPSHQIELFSAIKSRDYKNRHDSFNEMRWFLKLCRYMNANHHKLPPFDRLRIERIYRNALAENQVVFFRRLLRSVRQFEKRDSLLLGFS